MPEHNRPPPRDATVTATSRSPLASAIRWLQIKKYQYEVTFSLYMLTSTEKAVFNVIILVLLSLLIAAAVCYLPNHVAVISNRLWYYVHGEFLYAQAAQQQAQVVDVTATKEVLWRSASGLVEGVGSTGAREL